MKKKLFCLPAYLIMLILFLVTGRATASHIAGAEITYRHISGNQYTVNLNLFVDCNGFDPGATQTINLASSCGQTLSLNVSVQNPGGTEVSQICPAQLGSTVCSGGSLPGMWIFRFSNTITLPSNCNNWKMTWTTCCRNAATVNLVSPGAVGTYVETTVNSLTDSTDSSPYFTAESIPYVCAGQPFNYNCGAVEPDGDSLFFSLISAEDAGATALAYNSGYSGTSPIPGMIIDPATGMLSFTPSTIGTFVVVVLVKEFDSNGNLLGTVMRDIQFKVMSCTNNAPSASGGVITNFSGSASLTGTHSIEMCSGQNFSFDVIYTDPDSSDVLGFQSNIGSVLPGALITSTGSNPLTVHVNYNSSSSLPAFSAFNIDVNDGACPVMGLQTFNYSVSLLPGTFASPDRTICGSQSVALNASGGSSFTWSVISGPPMAIGTNFSCNTCASPVASPTATTAYQVVSNLSSGCRNTDTVTVNVVPSFIFNATSASPGVCISQPEQLNVSPTGSGYTFMWSPATGLSNANISNPVATLNSGGTYTYTVSVNNGSGCTENDTVSFNVLANAAPRPVIVSSDTSVCAGTTIQLDANVSSPFSPVCGITSIGCVSASTVTAGTGATANTNSTYPAPYGNWYSSVKQQYLYTAAELRAAGITGGKIDQLDFNVTTIYGITNYMNYSISMGCTGLSSFSSTSSFESGLFNVFPSQTFAVTTGWNQHAFTNAFEWDGISNVIVEVCMNQITGSGPNYTMNCVSASDSTSFNSCIYALSDLNDMCSTPATSVQPLRVRPMIRLHYCSDAADSTNYVYSWTPSGSVVSPSSQVTNALVTAPTSYSVTVTDTSSGCFSTASEMINLSGINMVIRGNVDYAGSPVNGFAKLFSFVSGAHMPLSDSVQISAGNYSFINISPGSYIIQASPDTALYPLAVPTYYNAVVTWDSASVISMLMCNDTITANVSLLGHPSLSGTNTLSGTLIEGTGYVHSAGMALEGINVMLLNNSTGIVADHTRSNSSGYYQFQNIPAGCYKIYVDIPGLPMDSTYHVCVASNNTLTNLNFIADANSVFITNSVLSVEQPISFISGMSVYPNPSAGLSTIEYHLSAKSSVDLEVMNALGETIGTLVNEARQPGTYKLELNQERLGLAPGVYFIRMKTKEGTIIRKIVFTK